MSGNLIVTIDREQKPLALTTSRFNKTIYIIHLVIRVRRRALVFSIQACCVLKSKSVNYSIDTGSHKWTIEGFLRKKFSTNGKNKIAIARVPKSSTQWILFANEQPTNTRRSPIRLPQSSLYNIRCVSCLSAISLNKFADHSLYYWYEWKLAWYSSDLPGIYLYILRKMNICYKIRIIMFKV